MKLFFKINKSWVEPDINKEDEELIALNYTFDSLQNPTDYTSEYSYDISLPKTQKNNRLFDEYHVIDSTIKYQPTEKIDYIYISNGDTISNGEAYLTKITEDHYEFALNGSLYAFFSKLLNSGWDTTNEDDDYYLLNEEWDGVRLTADTVNTSFNTDSITYDWDTVEALTNTKKFAQFAGLMQTNGAELDNFEISKWVVNDSGTLKILPVGDYDEDTENNIDVDEMTPQQMAEWRCYKMRPYVYVLRLFQIYKQYCKAITGYDLVLDSRWMNESYEFLKGLVYTLPTLDTENDSQTNQTVQYSNVAIPLDSYDDWLNYTTTIQSQTITCSGANTARYEWDIPLRFLLNGGSMGAVLSNYIFSPYQFIYLRAKVTNGTTDYYDKTYIYVPEPNAKMNDGESYQYTVSSTAIDLYKTIADYVKTYRYDTEGGYIQNTNQNYVTFGDITGKIDLHNVTNAYLQLTINVGHQNISTYNNNPIKVLKHYYRWRTAEWSETVEVADMSNYLGGYYDTTAIVDNTLILANGNGSKMSLERLFGDVPPFQVLLKFSKMVGLLWIVDDYNKKVTLIRRPDYFWDCFNRDLSVKSPSIYPYTGWYDITDLTDMSSYEIQPLAWDSHNICMNFSEGENDYSKDYAEKYGMTFGSKLIHTENKLNSDTVDLMGDSEANTIYPPIFTAEYRQPLNALLSGQSYKLRGDNYLADSDNVFCYRLENSTYTADDRAGWRVDTNGAFVLLTNDSTTENTAMTYCWHYTQDDNDVKTYVRPVFSEANTSQYCIMFAQPYEVYSTDFPASKSVRYLYEECWSDYIREVYNPDNKTITVQSHISGQIYNRLKIVPFVLLGNIGYMVMEMQDWSDADLTTMVLRQVSDLATLYNKSKSKNTTKEIVNSNESDYTADSTTDDIVAPDVVIPLT